MNKNKWTDEQKKAIETEGCSLLVAAAAGSGKTSVLVERIIQKIVRPQNPLDIDKLLVVTFTNAAAAEMRERIGEALSREIDKNPHSSRLQKQLALIGKANISTIHSFCLEVIRNNIHMIDMDTNFKIADETECILLKQQCLDEVLEEKYSSGDKNFIALADSLNGKDDSKLEEMVLTLHKFAMSSPWPYEWLRSSAENFNISDDYDFGNTKYAKEIVKTIKIELTGYKKNIEDALSTVRSNDELLCYEEVLTDDLRIIRSIVEAQSFNEIRDMLSASVFMKFPSKRISEQMKCKKEKIKAVRDKEKNIINKIKEEIFSVNDEAAADIKEMYPVIKALTDTAEDFDKKYGEAKRERGIIDFNDIEHFSLNILTEKCEDGRIIPSHAAAEYREKFEEILIDEYQDSNLVQEEILKSISRRNKDDIPYNIFMVGDVKQSIYKFRQARPELFLSKYNSFSQNDECSPQRKIKLFKNFRSREEIINGANYIFENIMTKDIGELEYDESEALNEGAFYPMADDGEICGGPIELHIAEKLNDESSENSKSDEDSENGENDENERSVPNIEAKIASKRINELVNGKDGKKFMVYDSGKNSYRPAEYKDIVILMRATSSWASIFMKELLDNGIPAYADISAGYFETTEIKIMLSFLKIVDNPLQDIPLLAVLRSPIASFSAEELMEIRMADPDVPFYEAMKKYSKEGSTAAKKCMDFINTLSIYRKKIIHMPIDDFIWYAYTETGYYGYCSAMPKGEQRTANLRLLFEKAREYEKTSYKGLYNFISFIDKVKNSSGDMGSAKILGENENVVRIMSIHKSKGLEFPIVFLCGSGRKFNMTDLDKGILCHYDMGLGPDYVNLEKRISYPTLMKTAIKKRTILETLSEEMRILYVAFTRAKEKLIITGSVNNIEKCIEKWKNAAQSGKKNLPENFIIESRTYLDWICASLMKHQAGETLLKAIGDDTHIMSKEASKWDILIWNKENIINENVIHENDDTDIIKELESINQSTGKTEYHDEVIKRLNYVYEYKEASSVPAKLTVSEIKSMISESYDDDESDKLIKPSLLKKPAFLEDKKGFSPAEKGILMHLVMQHIRLNETSDEESIKKEIMRLKQNKFMTDEQANAVDSKKISAFFSSDIGKRLVHSKSVKREMPFYMKVKAGEIYENLKHKIYDDEEILIQGIIDCFFEEDDGIVLIDYKTDYAYDIERIKSRYELQLNYYKRAIEEITDKKVKEKYLYLFYNDTVLKV